MLAEALLHALHDGYVLAGRLPAKMQGYSAWVGIYPLNLARPETRELVRREGVKASSGKGMKMYRVRTFEIADALLDACVGEAELKNARSWIVVSDDELLERLRELCVPLDLLDWPRRVDYPL